MTAPLDVRRVPLPLVIGADVLAFVLFVLAGLKQHGELQATDAFVRNLVPLLGAWFAVAAATKVYRRADLGAFLLTWVIAVPLGLVVRTVWVGSPSAPARIALFFAVAMSFTLLFLAIARTGAWLVARGLRRERAEQA